MNHRDHVALLLPGVPASAGVWADIGSGGGAFTLALAELLDAGSVIFSIDKDQRILERQATQVRSSYPHVSLYTVVGDFTAPLELPPLDGVVMANSLHFVPDKLPVLIRIRSLLKPNGRFLLVEYDVDRGNRWVPYPLSFATWQSLAAEAGFQHTKLLGRRTSSFLKGFYSAASW